MTELFFKELLEDYTEDEFFRFVREFFEDTNATPFSKHAFDKHIDKLEDHFEKITQHPEGCGLLYDSMSPISQSPENIVQEIKRWRAEQGLPGFKQ